MIARGIAATVLLTMLGCGQRGEAGAASASASATFSAPTVTAVDVPAAIGSASPGLSVGKSGTLYLSWQTRDADSTLHLRFATRTVADTMWSRVRDVATGKNMFVSATDVPTVHELPNHGLVALWRGSHGEAGYDVAMAHSEDAGATWSKPSAPHSDITPTEHGFVSWLRLGDTTGIVFLDGRMTADKDKSKQATHLTLAMFDATNGTKRETVLDSMVCDCCHTSSAVVPGGAVIAYRDRHEGEIRDISVLRIAGNSWRAPVNVHADNWHIDGCPVNGPSVSAHDADVAVAWFTAANDSARVRVAFSSDTASTFGAPVEVNEGFPDGKVGVAMVSADVALVSWIERRDAMAVLRVRTVRRDGTRSAVTDVAEVGEGKRAGGAPKLVHIDGHIFVVWTDAAGNRIRMAEIKAS